ncbi:MAG: hypothetical protein WCP85_21665 [Mariniphaga sp.]
MSTCKKCGKKTPILSFLCEDCKKEQESLAFNKKRKLEEEIISQKEEEKKKLIEKTKTIITDIVNATTQDEPQLYLLLNHDIKFSENVIVSGESIGRSLGGGWGITGLIGEIIGHGNDVVDVNITGNIGILVVTKENIIIKSIKTELENPNWISYEELKYLHSQITTSHFSIKEKMFKINKSQIFKDRIITDNSDFSFWKSDVYNNNSLLYEIPNQSNFVILCEELGSIITKEESAKREKEKNIVTYEDIINTIDETTKNIIKQMNRNEAIEFCREKFNLSIKDAKRLINEIV